MIRSWRVFTGKRSLSRLSQRMTLEDGLTVFSRRLEERTHT